MFYDLFVDDMELSSSSSSDSSDSGSSDSDSDDGEASPSQPLSNNSSAGNDMSCY